VADGERGTQVLTANPGACTQQHTSGDEHRRDQAGDAAQDIVPNGHQAMRGQGIQIRDQLGDPGRGVVQFPVQSVAPSGVPVTTQYTCARVADRTGRRTSSCAWVTAGGEPGHCVA
jgi:hypothetical protein